MIRFAHAIYCDDVRHEVGNKVSFIGVYHGKMFVQSFPIVIPKLCIALWARTPFDRPFHTLAIKLLLGDKVLLDVPLPDDIPGPRDDRFLPNDSTKALTVYTSLVLTPFPLEGPTVLKLRVQTEEEELKAGGLEIELAAQTNEPSQTRPQSIAEQNAD